MEPVKEESEDFKPNIPELEPVRLRECSVVLERICVREQGAGEEGSPNSTQGGGKEDGLSLSECSLGGSSPAAKARAGAGEYPDCGKGFTQFGRLKMHQQTQTGEKPYRCADCGKSFSREFTQEKNRIVALTVGRVSVGHTALFHTSEFTQERNHIAALTGKSFSQSRDLKTHQRIHTGEKPYRCSDCGKSFIDSGNMKKHQQIHTGEKPYFCSDCEKSFSRSDSLISHQRVHRGEKPYCCSVCGKSFSWLNNLVSHRRTHTGEKPYFCSDCGKSFSRSDSLVSHQRVHRGEKPEERNRIPALSVGRVSALNKAFITTSEFTQERNLRLCSRDVVLVHFYERLNAMQCHRLNI
ncbi:UNVERIFIED_CONTAM: hypothetical protein FKN15_031859 [Acipenser sinensis]